MKNIFFTLIFGLGCMGIYLAPKANAQGQIYEWQYVYVGGVYATGTLYSTEANLVGANIYFPFEYNSFLLISNSLSNNHDLVGIFNYNPYPVIEQGPSSDTITIISPGHGFNDLFLYSPTTYDHNYTGLNYQYWSIVPINQYQGANDGLVGYGYWQLTLTPEPSTMALAGVGLLLGVAGRRFGIRRQTRRH